MKPVSLPQIEPTPRSPQASAGADVMPILCLDPGGHTAIVKQVLFTPDGRELISVGYDKVIRIWDVGTGQAIRTLRGQAGPGSEGMIYAAALGPDGRTLATGGWSPGRNQYITLFDFLTGQVTALLRGHTNVILALAFAPDGTLLASGSHYHTVRVWHPGSGTCKHVLPGTTGRCMELPSRPMGRG